MSRLRIIVLGGVALLLSGVLTLVIYRQIRSRLLPATSAGVTRQIVVAAERLPLGALIESQHVKTVPWSADVPLEGSFQDPSEVIGRGVVTPLLPNEPILESKLAPKEAGAGLTSAIPLGMRAVSVRVNEVIGVAGFVVPGSKVDVILIGSPGGRVEEEIAKMVLENVQVLAAGQNVERDARGTPQTVQVVTLLVTPEQAQTLALAASEARIQLALRNPIDLEHAQPPPVRRTALYTGPSSVPPEISAERPPAPRRVQRRPPAAPPPPPPPPPKVFSVELIRGQERTVLTFEEEKKQEARPSPEGNLP